MITRLVLILQVLISNLDLFSQSFTVIVTKASIPFQLKRRVHSGDEGVEEMILWKSISKTRTVGMWNRLICQRRSQRFRWWVQNISKPLVHRAVVQERCYVWPCSSTLLRALFLSYFILFSHSPFFLFLSPCLFLTFLCLVRIIRVFKSSWTI